MRVVLIGATGEVGRQIAEQLLSKTDVEELRVIARRSLNLSHPKLKTSIISFDDMSTVNLSGFDLAISALGTTMRQAGSKEAFKRVDFNYNLNFAQHVKAAGIDEFHIVSAMGADANSAVFYNKIKGELENALKQIAFKTLVFYRPSLLDSERKEKRSAERVAILAMRVLNVLLVGGLKKFRSIKVDKVAQGIVNRLGALDGTHIILSDRI